MAVTSSQLAAQLINYEVYKGGDRLLGTASVDLSDVKFKTANIAGAGIAGEIEMPTLAFPESLQITLNWRSINQHFKRFLPNQASDLTIYGAEQIYDAGTGRISPQQVKINMRGLIKENNFGKFEPANTTDSSSVFEVIYLKIAVAKTVIMELDKVNYIYSVDGTDYLAEVRTALNI